MLLVKIHCIIASLCVGACSMQLRTIVFEVYLRRGRICLPGKIALRGCVCLPADQALLCLVLRCGRAFLLTARCKLR